MKTVLEVNSVMNRGGAETMLMELVRKLHNDFRFVFLLNVKKGTRPKGDFDDEIKSLGCPIYYIDAVWDVGIKEYERQFNHILDMIGHVDVIHSHLNSKGGIISRCAYKRGIPKRIVHSHAKIVFNGSLPYRIAMNSELLIQRRWINKYATDYWGCSEAALHSLFTRAHCSSEKAKVIHNAIELEKYTSSIPDTIRDELHIANGELIIGTVGRIATVKNYELAADIISTLWKQGIHCHYIVAGREQDDKSVQYLFDKLGSDSRFHYLGIRADVERLYRGFDLYLGTSLREGLGLTAVEAQACGIHCIVSEGYPKLCDIGAGLVHFVNGTNPTLWADAVIEFMKEEKISLSESAVCVRNAGFDISTEAETVKNLYNA